MKRLTKLMSLGLVLMMVVGMLSACGSKKDDAKSETKVSDGGKKIVIRCWNDEFASRMANFCPGYEANNKEKPLEGGKYNGIVVEFIQVENQDNAYQKQLDAALKEQANKSGDELIDAFLVEADYAAKYVQTSYTADVTALGITAADLSKQYQYTKDAVTDAKGILKGVSWQACPAGLIYRRDIAKEVLGTDDPAEVQKAVANWAEFEKTAQKMKDAGYTMLSGYDDTFRVFSNNATSKWVIDGKLNIDKAIKDWADQTKNFTDKGFNDKTSLWADEWNANMATDAKVFCFFGPAWMIDFCMHAGDKGYVANEGGWALTEGPQSFFWGGTWICPANGTDNAKELKEIILAMTTNDDVMKNITEKANDFVNNKPLMEKMAASDYSSEVLGGQNPLGIFANIANTISLKNLTTYDQGCNEEFQAAMKDYFTGNTKTYEDAVAAFKNKLKDKYPELKMD